MSLTLDQLRVLKAIDAEGSFAAAGRLMHRTTSAISYGIKTLEAALSLELFDRSGHRARLTEAGHHVLEEAEAILTRVNKLERIAAQLEARWETSLRIVVDGILPQQPVMSALRQFTRERAPTHVQIDVEYLRGVRERFEGESADLMLALDFVGDDKHVAMAMPPVSMLLLCHRDHPMVMHSSLSRRDLASHVELVVEDSSSLPSPVTPRLSLGSPHVFRLSDFSSKRRALLAGVGFGWMPVHLVHEELSAGTLVPVHFEEGDEFSFIPHLVHRRDRLLGRAAALFMELLIEEVRDEARSQTSHALS